MQKNTLKYIFLFVAAIGMSFAGCKKFVETKAPDTLVNGDNVYTNDVTAIAVMTGLYSKMSSGSPAPNISSGDGSFSLLCGLSADEYTLFTGADSKKSGFYQNALIANLTTNIGTDYWNVLYEYIFYVNTAIEGLNNSTGLSETVKQQLLGEAKFMRGFYYFYLVNLYGDVPLILTTDYKNNTVLSRTPKADVYLQIKKDLQDAEGMLSADYLDGKLQKYTGVAERIRPTKWAAKALLARVYLYVGDNANAEAKSTEVISNSALYDTVSINNVFLKNSREAIWQLQVVKAGQNTDDSKTFIVSSGFSNSTPVRLSDTLLNSFEAGDLRAQPKNWTDTIRIPATTGTLYHYPYKYKNNSGTVTEYIMVMRLAEQYLIRAEARAQLGNTAGAVADLNVIRRRAGLTVYGGSTTQASLLSAVLHERQVEFFSEWGHRWFDIKRTNTADALMSIITPKKGGTWQATDKLYPLPYIELQRGPNLIQNPGYN